MRRFRNYILILTLLVFPLAVTAQYMPGKNSGNYSGVSSLELNPSALHNSKTWLDVEFLGAEAFLQNNMLYQTSSDYRFSHFFQSGYEYPTHKESYGTEERAFYIFNNTKPKNAFINMKIDGPGAMLIWGKHAFAITTAFRNIISGHNIPYDIANFMYLGMNYRPQQKINYNDIRPFDVTQLAWAEIGLSYAYEVYARGFNRISAGLSVKRLMGVSGGYAKIYNIDYTVIDDSTIQVRNLKTEIGLSLPIDYDQNAVWNEKLIKGGGFGFDLGVTYQRLIRPHHEQYFNRLCEQQYEDYLYRIGVALIDVGGIRFKTHAQKYIIDNQASYWDQVTRIRINSVNQIMDTVSYKFYGDKNAAKAGEKFMMWLPAALSLQFDYHFTQYTYINAGLIYPLMFAKSEVYRPAVLSVTPRYERRWLEVSLPVSLYDWSLLRVGLAVRIYGFTIGTDKLGGFLHVNDFTGLDAYFSIRFFLNKGSCRVRNKGQCGNLEFRPD